MKLLALCDSPTFDTGFARVARNLLSRWHKADIFEDIWVWGIGYTGFPHDAESVRFLQNRICPASTFDNPSWHAIPNLERFLTLLQRQDVGGTPGGFTHLWIMQDTFLLFPMAQAIKKICEAHKITSLLYFPVDAPLEPEWVDIVDVVKYPVAYCEYGRAEARKALEVPVPDDKLHTVSRRKSMDRIRVLPHGVDTSIYKPPVSLEESNKNRKTLFRGVVSPNDFVMVNVNQNQKRKGLTQSLQILKALKALHPELSPRLYMHMHSLNENDQFDLRAVARQLGLKAGEDLFFGDSCFQRGNPITGEDSLAAIYGAADLLLTTTLGEGWGLSITEAMACGTPVAGPLHTSVAEILADDRGILFDTQGEDVLPADNSRLRPRTDVLCAAKMIGKSAIADSDDHFSIHQYAERGSAWARSDFLSWDRVADEWAKLFLDDVQ